MLREGYGISMAAPAAAKLRRVGSLALLSGLRIQRCREMWWRLQTRLGSRVAVAVV